MREYENQTFLGERERKKKCLCFRTGLDMKWKLRRPGFTSKARNHTKFRLHIKQRADVALQSVWARRQNMNKIWSLLWFINFSHSPSTAAVYPARGGSFEQHLQLRSGIITLSFLCKEQLFSEVMNINTVAELQNFFFLSSPSVFNPSLARKAYSSALTSKPFEKKNKKKKTEKLQDGVH